MKYSRSTIYSSFSLDFTSNVTVTYKVVPVPKLQSQLVREMLAYSKDTKEVFMQCC